MPGCFTPEPSSICSSTSQSPSVSCSLHSTSLMVPSWSPFLLYHAGPHGRTCKPLPLHHLPFVGTLILQPPPPNQMPTGGQHNKLCSYNWTAKHCWREIPQPWRLLLLQFPIFSPTCLLSHLSLVQSLSHSSQTIFQIFHYHPQALYSTLLASLLVENFVSYSIEKIEAIRIGLSNFSSSTTYNLISIHTHPPFLLPFQEVVSLPL